MPAAERSPLLLGIDLGAGSLKATLIHIDGSVAGEASHVVPTLAPHPGWSEQNPSDWWAALVRAVPSAIAASGGDANRIVGIALSAGAHSQVLEDADGEVIRPAIMWNDQRSRAEVQELRDRADRRILDVGYNRCSTTWTLPQLLWVRKNEPQAAARTARVYLAKDWLRARLTGTFETDTIDALGTLMLDAPSAKWSEELCKLIDWPLDTLPPVVQPTAIVGKVTREAAAATGLAAGCPVICGTSDTAAETYGAGMVETGLGVIKLATAATMSVLSAKAVPNGELINYYHVVPGHWYLIAGTNSCASAHRWLRDQFFMPVSGGTDGSAVFSEMDRMAASCPPGAEGLMFHPYLNGERSPYWDPLLRADFIGMTMRHRREHFVRALYEGIAFSLRDCFEVFKANGQGFSVGRITGGGARSATWRQIVSDVLGIPIELPAVADASFGAALIAGVGAGIYPDEVSAVRKTLSVTARHEPDARRTAFYERAFGIYKDAQARLAPVNHALHALATGAA